MPLNEIHVGDSTEFRITIYDNTSTVDLSTASTTSHLVLKKPGGTNATQTISFFSSTSGVIAFTATTATFDVAGEWQAQAVLVMSNGTFHSDVYKFTVHSNL